MSQSSDERVAEFYARTYDESVPDWPGEMDFYQEMAGEVKRHGGKVLEIACGTGRVAIRLAQNGVNVVGLDLSTKMLEVAQQKSGGLENIRWVQGGMRSFELGEAFDLVIIPGHSFQNLNTSQDQVACLECIQRHLSPGGFLVVHLDQQSNSGTPSQAARYALSGRGPTSLPVKLRFVRQPGRKSAPMDKLSIAGKPNRFGCTVYFDSRWNTCWRGSGLQSRRYMGISFGMRWRTRVQR